LLVSMGAIETNIFYQQRKIDMKRSGKR
jgi:hypothetical protein